jgi:type I restriction enzyme, S subunit
MTPSHPLTRFGDVVREIREAEREPLENGLERLVGLEHIEPENLHIKQWGSVEDGTSFTRVFRKGQVLFGKRRAYQRKVALAEFDGICSSDIIVMEAIKGKLLPELLPFIVQSEGFFEYALSTSAGSLSPRTKWKHLSEYQFLLPPIDEQRRIAEILWAADEVVEKWVSQCKKQHQLLIKTCQVWTFPKGEDARDFRLHEVAEILDNERIPLNKETRSNIKGDIPYYGATGIIDYVDDYIFADEIVLIGEDGDHFLKWQYQSQTHLVRGKSWVNNHAHVFRAMEKYCSNEWLYRYFQFRNINPYLQDSASMSRKKLTKQSLRGIPVKIPSKGYQIDSLEKINDIELSYKAALLHLERCKIMHSSLLTELIAG